MRRYRFHVLGMTVLASVVVAAWAVSGAGGGQAGAGHATAQTAVSGKISMIGIWTATEQKSFQAVIAGFNKKFPNVKVTYTSGGNNTPTILQTAIQGGHPPDVAAIGQPALVKQFAKQGHLQPITFAAPQVKANLGA